MWNVQQLGVSYQLEKQKPWVSRHKGAMQVLGIFTACSLLFVAWLYWGFHMVESSYSGIVGVKGMTKNIWHSECVDLMTSLTSSEGVTRCWFPQAYDLDKLQYGEYCTISQVGMDIVIVSCQKPTT